LRGLWLCLDNIRVACEKASQRQTLLILFVSDEDN